LGPQVPAQRAVVRGWALELPSKSAVRKELQQVFAVDVAAAQEGGRAELRKQCSSWINEALG
jgi:hypothetical protein